MSQCISSAKAPTISVTLKDYQSGCQCIPAPNPPCPTPPHVDVEADRLKEARQIILSGDASGQASFDGSADANINVTIPTVSNLEIEDILRGDDVPNESAFLDNNGVLFLWEKVKAFVEEATENSGTADDLTPEQINKLLSNIDIINGGSAQ